MASKVGNATQAAAVQLQTTVGDARTLVDGLDGKLNGTTAGTDGQPSPGSANSEKSSVDSGLHDDIGGTPKLSNGIGGGGSNPRSGGTSVSPVLEQLEQMIVSDEWLQKEDAPFAGSTHQALVKTRSRAETTRLSELGRALVTSASLKAYVDLLGSHHRQSIAGWLFGNTSETLAQLFRFPGAQLHCTEPESTYAASLRSAIAHSVRLALRDAYGAAYAEEGWKAFEKLGSPVVYVSPAVHLELKSYLAAECGIADVVVLDRMEGELAAVESRIDHAAFEKRVEADIAAGKRPLLVVAVVGSTVLGQNDIVSKLLEIRQKHRFWVQIVGQAVAALALREPTELLVSVLSRVDSFTMPLALWLGLPAVPLVTLHRPLEGYRPSYKEKLDSLPWWVATQHLTSKRITDQIEQAYFLSKIMLKGLSEINQIEIVGIEQPASFAAKVYKNQYTAPTVLTFKYRYNALKEARDAHVAAVEALHGSPDESAEREELQKKVDQAAAKLASELEYADSLNSWLGQGLMSEVRSLGLNLIELGAPHGTAFRYCPLESAAANQSHPEHVQRFVAHLLETLPIIDSTVAARDNFATLRNAFPQLVLLPIERWAGVGAVCYVPSIVKDTAPAEWNDSQRQQVTHLNLELVHALRSVDSAFSTGESAAYGVSCVKFGMLSDAKDLDELVKMVAAKGQEIENSQQYIDSLAALIKQGIDAANEDLRKAQDERLQQEGVLRQLPIMGSLINWMAPMEERAAAIKGRAFDLKTGQILPTERLYRLRATSTDGAVPITPIETPANPHVFPAASAATTADTSQTPVILEEPSKET